MSTSTDTDGRAGQGVYAFSSASYHVSLSDHAGLFRRHESAPGGSPFVPLAGQERLMTLFSDTISVDQKPPPIRGRADILLVDDHPANLLALESILQELGRNLVNAHSGEEALRRLLVSDFAVILLDVQMT